MSASTRQPRRGCLEKCSSRTSIIQVSELPGAVHCRRHQVSSSDGGAAIAHAVLSRFQTIVVLYPWVFGGEGATLPKRGKIPARGCLHGINRSDGIFRRR